MRRPISAIARFTLIEAARARLAWMLLGILLICAAAAAFLAALAITESTALRAGVLGGGMRISAVVLAALFVINSVVRDFHDHSIDLVLSRPVTRTHYYLGRIAGYGVVCSAIAALCGVFMACFVAPGAAAIWTVSLCCELLIVASFAFTCAITFNQMPAALLATAGFYLLSRAMGAIVLMSSSPLTDSGSAAQSLLDGLVAAIAVVLPELWRFTQAEWVMREAIDRASLPAIAVQTVVYLLLLAGVALIDLHRRPV